MAWYNDVGDWFCDRGEDIWEVWGTATDLLVEAGDSFSKGNIMGGISQGVEGIAAYPGAVLTGGADAYMARRHEKLDKKDYNCIDKAYRAVCDTINESYADMHALEDNGQILEANGVGAMHVAADAALAVGGAYAGSAIAGAGSAAATATAMTGAKVGAAKLAVKGAVKGVGTGILTSHTVNNIANETYQPDKDGNYEKNEKGKIVANSNAIGDGLYETLKDTTEVAAQAVEDAGSLLFNDGIMQWLYDKVPVVARFVNTARAGVSAGLENLAETDSVAYPRAVCAKAIDKVSSWLSREEGQYDGMSMSQIAEKMKEKSLSDGNNSFKELYAKYVKTYDGRVDGMDKETKSRGWVNDVLDSGVDFVADKDSNSYEFA